MKPGNNTKSLEKAILAKFKDAQIYDIRHDKYGTHVLGIVPARDDHDSDHIVEWNKDGIAMECRVDDRDYREIGWDAEEQKPVYIEAKLLLHNERFNIDV